MRSLRWILSLDRLMGRDIASGRNLGYILRGKRMCGVRGRHNKKTHTYIIYSWGHRTAILQMMSTGPLCVCAGKYRVKVNGLNAKLTGYISEYCSWIPLVWPGSTHDDSRSSATLFTLDKSSRTIHSVSIHFLLYVHVTSLTFELHHPTWPLNRDADFDLRTFSLAHKRWPRNTREYLW